MRALITGATGQLGVELLRSVPANVEVAGVTHAQCDISVPSDIDAAIEAYRPAVVINAAAYTAVDDAELHPELAHTVNADGAGNVARAAHKAGARTVHISTDYVFDGAKRVPYTIDDSPHPINEYGRSKAAGEQQVLGSSSSSLIIRSGWLYASHGKNFLRTILSALRASRPLRVVDDQIGVPTTASGLAGAIWKCVAADMQGVVHWADDGTASWFDFAVAIQKIALDTGLLTTPTQIVPVTSDAYPLPARRPQYSVLDASALWRTTGAPRHWTNALEATIAEDEGRHV